jgi:hypothetical protein
MTKTALGGDYDEPPPQPGCWCCGDRTVCGSLLRLEAHPEVGVCFRCVDSLVKRKRKLQRMTRAAPPGPWWRRLQYRAGFGHC